MSEHDRLAHIELKVALGASKRDRLSSKIIWTVIILSAAVIKTIISSFFEPACSSRTADPDRTILPQNVKLKRRRNTSAPRSFFATSAVIGFQMC